MTQTNRDAGTSPVPDLRGEAAEIHKAPKTLNGLIGTEFLKGQGMGNRLFCYITARCIAMDRNCRFGTAGRQFLDVPQLALDLGEDLDAEMGAEPADAAAQGGADPGSDGERRLGRFTAYHEAEARLYLPNSPHDLIHGCYVGGADPGVLNAAPDTLLYGNLQAQEYFARHRDEIRQWLKVRPEYESDEYTADDLCILNIRGGEYADDPALFLRRRYWLDAMRRMRKEVPGMRFMTVTDDVKAASKLLPEVPAYHFSPEKDYVTVKNARYLILSNSSFAFFPAYTSDTVRKVIAPKYWARHNVSDGYWSGAQNIYDDFLYLDRKGKLYTAEECRAELTGYIPPKTQPRDPADPEVERVRRRNTRRVLVAKAGRKILRILKRK